MLNLTLLREFLIPGSLSVLLTCPDRRKLEVFLGLHSRNDMMDVPDSVNSAVIHEYWQILSVTHNSCVQGKEKVSW
jgi:hypothetical protein